MALFVAALMARARPRGRPSHALVDSRERNERSARTAKVAEGWLASGEIIYIYIICFFYRGREGEREREKERDSFFFLGE